MDEESYDYQLIEELFNPEKRIRIGKGVLGDHSRGRSLAAHVSRIDTDYDLDDSDSSIVENQTYQALQKYNLNKILKEHDSAEMMLRENLDRSL